MPHYNIADGLGISYLRAFTGTNGNDIFERIRYIAPRWYLNDDYRFFLQLLYLNSNESLRRNIFNQMPLKPVYCVVRIDNTDYLSPFLHPTNQIAARSVQESANDLAQPVKVADGRLELNTLAFSERE